MSDKVMAIFVASLFFVTGITYADVYINAASGNSLLFSQKRSGDGVVNNAWSKLYFVSGGNKTELVSQGRYYEGGSKKSPSGNYILFYSVSGEFVSLEDGTDKYVDRAYCSVIDMRDGCIVSDWDGEACGYDWVNNQDILASSAEKGADIFDFMAMRPSINMSNSQRLMNNEESVKNLLRCSPPNRTNVEAYQVLLKSNNKYFSNIRDGMLRYLINLPGMEVKNKTPLFSEPNSNSKSKAYLISGDKVKFIQNSPDGRWINIAYINSKKVPLITWIEAINVK